MGLNVSKQLMGWVVYAILAIVIAPVSMLQAEVRATSPIEQELPLPSQAPSGTSQQPSALYYRRDDSFTRPSLQSVPGNVPGGYLINQPDPMQVQKRQMILDIARTQLWVDKDANRNYVVNAYSRGKDEAWCADFVSTVLQWSIGSPWGHEALANNIYLWGMNNNRLTLSPAPGDIALFRYGSGDISHVAIVEAVNPDQIITIGGNEGPRKGGNGGGGIVQRSRYRFGDPNIIGFINPVVEVTLSQK